MIWYLVHSSKCPRIEPRQALGSYLIRIHLLLPRQKMVQLDQDNYFRRNSFSFAQMERPYFVRLWYAIWPKMYVERFSILGNATKFWSALAQLIYIFRKNSFQRNWTKAFYSKNTIKIVDMLCAQAIKPDGNTRSVTYSTYLALGLYEVCIRNLDAWWVSDSFWFIEPCTLS